MCLLIFFNCHQHFFFVFYKWNTEIGLCVLVHREDMVPIF